MSTAKRAQQRVAAFFAVAERGSTLATEVRAGALTFLDMVYVLIVVPALLAHVGVDRTQAVVAVALSSALSTLLCGVVSNLPFGLAPGLGITGTCCQSCCVCDCYCCCCFYVHCRESPTFTQTLATNTHTLQRSHYHMITTTGSAVAGREHCLSINLSHTRTKQTHTRAHGCTAAHILLGVRSSDTKA
jgi:hypothetical protein